MSDTAIRIRHLSKQYRLGRSVERYHTARDTIARAVARPFRRRRAAGESARAPSGHETLLALDDVSFDVRVGEVVGVIGRNGAGKSTLLKILSRITEPSGGYADVYGRLGSLLEVGSGFHQELTGRENIYLNAAILGMSRHEVHRKFDEIVEFAEVGRFIDTPVKHYSSGMHLRLAFSVAAHLEPEILVVDEVLAVGDAIFQKKCLGKMEDVASHGRTVLFVSHNLGVVKELCQTSVVLERGRLVFHGPVLQGLARYTEALQTDPTQDGAHGAGWRGLQVNGSRSGAAQAAGGDALAVEAWLSLGERYTSASFICIIESSTGETMVHQRTAAPDDGAMGPGAVRVTIGFPPLWLSPGAYTVYLKFLGARPSGENDRAVSERVLLDVSGSRHGISRAVLAPAARWTVEQEHAPAAVNAS